APALVAPSARPKPRSAHLQSIRRATLAGWRAAPPHASPLLACCNLSAVLAVASAMRAAGVTGLTIAGRHRASAFHTELRVFRQHAGLHLALIGNELIAQPERIGRAGLAHI